jgi:hypothetical protein
VAASGAAIASRGASATAIARAGTAGGQQLPVDGGGNPVRLACVGYAYPVNINADIAGMVAAGFNCLRYPLYNGTLAQNLAVADQIVAAASQVGLKVILDHHGDEILGPNNGYLPYPCNGLPFDKGPGSNGTDGCGDVGTVTVLRYVADGRAALRGQHDRHRFRSHQRAASVAAVVEAKSGRLAPLRKWVSSGRA